MFAVIKSGGKQYRIKVGDILAVEKLDAQEGEKIIFDQVLLIEDDKNTLIGTPIVERAQVIGEVIENFKDKKVIVFKKKRRKQYRKKTGHRQELTRVKIEEIISDTEAPKKKPPEKKAEPKEAPKKPEPKKAKVKIPEAAAQKKKTPVKRSTAKKASTKAKKISPKKEK